MSQGSASWKLPYPDSTWKRSGYFSNDKSAWTRFIRLCKQLKRKKIEYSVFYIDMGKHCRALVEWRVA